MNEYRFVGNVNPGDGTERIVLEGTRDDPVRFVDLGGTIKMTAAEAEKFSGQHVLEKVTGEKSSSGTDGGKS